MNEILEPTIPADHLETVILEPVDRSRWPSGPWDQEPDRVEWRHAGFPCLIVRSRNTGALCGYVGLPPDHPHHGAPYDEVPVDVHGGLTYSDACRGGICHVPQAGEPADVWWLGFDCAHAWDTLPPHARVGLHASITTYRDVAQVTVWVNELAEQLAAAKPEGSPAP